MPDKYLLFAEEVPIPHLEAYKWLQCQLEFIGVDFRGHEFHEDPERMLGRAGLELEYCGYRFLHGVVDEHPDNPIEDATEIGFEVEFTFPTCKIYCRGDGSLDKVGSFMQQYLLQFKGLLEPVWHMTFALTCSRPEIGEFDGGYLVVTADKVIIELANQAMKRRLEQMESSVWE